jgi:hypothetical protein
MRMSRTLGRVLVIVAVIVGCGGDDTGGGNDTLPKRGAAASDPTIVSATAECNGGTDVRISASDPMGEANLGTCSVTIGGGTEQNTFSAGVCTVSIGESGCVPGPTVVAITVSNKTAGVTTASVTVTITPEDLPPDAPAAQ